MKKHWALWLVIGGLGIDIVDALTTKTAGAGGLFYNSTDGIFKGVTGLPGGLKLGELAASVGAGFLFMHKG